MTRAETREARRVDGQAGDAGQFSAVVGTEGLIKALEMGWAGGICGIFRSRLCEYPPFFLSLFALVFFDGFATPRRFCRSSVYAHMVWGTACLSKAKGA